MKYKAEVVSMAVVLRDWRDVEYLGEEHRKLVDIADSLFNIGMSVAKAMRPEYKKLFEKYGRDYWEAVLKDARAIDSQIEFYNCDDLMLDYNDYLSGAMVATI